MTEPINPVIRFRNGFSCSQVILSHFSDHGLDKETVCRLAYGFGTGMGRTGNICGAISGAVMVIGLKDGKATIDDDPAKEKTYTMVRQFITEFREKNGSINCTELLGCNLCDPEQRKHARISGALATKCPGFAEDAKEILEKILR